MFTSEQVQGYLLAVVRAFSGKRGRTGVVSFVLGQAGPSTLSLAQEHSIESLHGILSTSTQHDIHYALNQLQAKGYIEARETIIRDQSFPLIYLTDRGSFELERLRPKLQIQSGSARTPEKALLVLARLGKLLEGLMNESTVELPSYLGLGAQQFEHYLELLCKALNVRKEVPLSSPQARRQFFNKIEVGLCSTVFAELPEIEAQSLRLVTGIKHKHQLSAADIATYYPDINPEEKARDAAARILSREWQSKSPLASVIGFLVLSEPK